MAARKLRDRIAEATGLAITEGPQVEVPATDKTEMLAEAARKGFDAINALYAERNSASELAADLNQQLNHCRTLNIGLREEVAYYKQQCECLIKGNARLGAYLAQMSDVFRRISAETHQVNAMIESLPHPAPLSNNPDLPHVNSNGVPIGARHAEEEPLDLPEYDDTGLPYNTANDGPPPIDHAELQRLVHRINGGNENQLQ